MQLIEHGKETLNCLEQTVLRIRVRPAVLEVVSGIK